MGKQFKLLRQKDRDFIEKQKVFFIASCSDKEVNLSPKGYDTIRVLDEKTLLFLDFPGSGNRTGRDAKANGRFTLMFTAFEGASNILRLFCKAETVTKEDKRFDTFLGYFDTDKGIVRQLFLFHIYAVETSCGDGVPYMQYLGERPQLKEWAIQMENKGKLSEYIRTHDEPPQLEKL